MAAGNHHPEPRTVGDSTVIARLLAGLSAVAHVSVTGVVIYVMLYHLFAV
jgi:hypothetical protein